MKRIDLVAKTGRRIRELRLAKGLSQEDFADQVQLDRTYISGVERGVRNPTLKTLQRIAQGLGVSLSDMFRGIQ